MATTTLLTGLLLIVLGILGYEGGNHAATALIPAYFGIVLGVLGSMARTKSAKTRMIVMHIAVTVGLAGFLFTVSGLWDFIQMQRGRYLGDPMMIQDRAAMSAILLFFVLLCVRSFINARRTRDAAPASSLAGGRR